MLYSHPGMRVSLFWRSRRSRTALIVLLLLISLATASMIALQAQYSDASRRATAESVLHDYSALVADEVIRRSAAETGYYGYLPLMTALIREVQQSGALSPDLKTVFLTSQVSGLPRAASLGSYYFEMDRATGRVSFSGGEPGDGVVVWLRQNLVLVPPQGSDPGFKVFNTQIAGVPKTFVAVSARPPKGGERIAGFEVDLPALRQWLATALNRQPLVPASLGHGRVTN